MTSSLIDFYLFSFLPTDPTSFPWCSVEQEINLTWPYLQIFIFVAFTKFNVKKFSDIIRYSDTLAGGSIPNIDNADML